MSQCSFWLCGNSARIHARNSPQMHWKLYKSVTNFSLLALGANPSPWLFVLLFFHPLGCVRYVLCVHKEMWNTPGRRWEKPLDDSMTMSGLGGWDSGVQPAGVLSQMFLTFPNGIDLNENETRIQTHLLRGCIFVCLGFMGYQPLLVS